MAHRSPGETAWLSSPSMSAHETASSTGSQTPRHPWAVMQGPFEESMLETMASDEDEASNPYTKADSKTRRTLLLEQKTYERTVAGRWKQKPGEKFHPLWKLVSQISFGMHLLQQGLAKSDDEVIKILQTHVDEIDGFLERTTEDFDLAQKDIEERLQYLSLPLEHGDVFDTMLNDRTFRTAIVEGNEKIEHIVDRTASAMRDALKDVQKGLDSTKELARYLKRLEKSWRNRTEEHDAVYSAMMGNTEGWSGAFLVLQQKGTALTGTLDELRNVIAEIQRRAGIASRKNLSTVTSIQNSRRRSQVTSPRSYTPPLSPTKALPHEPRSDTSSSTRTAKPSIYSASASRSVLFEDEAPRRTRSQRVESEYRREGRGLHRRRSSATTDTRKQRRKSSEFEAITEATTKAQIPRPDQDPNRLTRRASLTERIKPLTQKLSFFKHPAGNISEPQLHVIGFRDPSKSKARSKPTAREPIQAANHEDRQPAKDRPSRATSFRQGHESVMIGTYEGVTSPYDLDDLIKSGPSIGTFSPDSQPRFANIDDATNSSKDPASFVNRPHPFLQDVKPVFGTHKGSVAYQSNSRRSKVKELPLRRFRSSEYLPMQSNSPVIEEYAPRRASSVKFTPTTAGTTSFLSPVSPQDDLLALFPQPRKRASTQGTSYTTDVVTESSSIYSPTSGSPLRVLDVQPQTIDAFLYAPLQPSAVPPQPRFNATKQDTKLESIPEPRRFDPMPKTAPLENMLPLRTPSPRLSDLVFATVSGPQSDIPYEFATLSPSPTTSLRGARRTGSDSQVDASQLEPENLSRVTATPVRIHTRNQSTNTTRSGNGTLQLPSLTAIGALPQNPYAVSSASDYRQPQYGATLHANQSADTAATARRPGLPSTPRHFLPADHERKLSADRAPRSPWKRLFGERLGHRKTRSESVGNGSKAGMSGRYF